MKFKLSLTILALLSSILAFNVSAAPAVELYCQDAQTKLPFVIVLSNWTQNEESGFYAIKEVQFIEEIEGVKKAKAYELFSNNKNLDSFNLGGLPYSMAPVAVLKLKFDESKGTNIFTWSSILSLKSYAGTCEIDHEKTFAFFTELEKASN